MGRRRRLSRALAQTARSGRRTAARALSPARACVRRRASRPRRLRARRRAVLRAANTHCTSIVLNVLYSEYAGSLETRRLARSQNTPSGCTSRVRRQSSRPKLMGNEEPGSMRCSSRFSPSPPTSSTYMYGRGGSPASCEPITQCAVDSQL